ncbi:MAG TPA: type II toxin-antitoxin system HigB family toxin [Cyclobacteriaceae bacterium]|nr:type II toxin-antitoxin system HigB family toxin [Cyclobacteriaceae bacterium]
MIRKETIADFDQAKCQEQAIFRDMVDSSKYTDWNEPSDIQDTFGTADLIGGGSSRVVFDIGGNNYRMICKYAFGEK